MTAAYLDLPVAQEIFAGPRSVLAWGPGPKARAVECEGGYKVTGVWAFASGCRHATWLGAQRAPAPPTGLTLVFSWYDRCFGEAFEGNSH
jgi:hypothetical protein